MSRWSIVCAMLVASLLSSPALASDVSRDWLELWTRCRIAIETAKPLNSNGLTALEAPAEARDDIAKKRYRASRFWSRNDGRFSVLELEQNVEGGVARLCKVDLAPGAGPLTDDEEGAIVREFLIERARLIAARTHVSDDLDPIYPLIPLGLTPKKPNPNGCSVISSLMFDPSSDTFMSLSGERLRPNCSGPSRLGEPAASGAHAP